MTAPESSPAPSWKLRTRTLAAGPIPLLMGIVNVTPDSFSDGGRFLDPAAAVEHGLRLAAEGADLLDMGGESTRPGAEPVAAGRRTPPRDAGDHARSPAKPTVPVSIDTSKAAVAREALDAGAEVINDVTALTGDADMLALAAQSGCGVCAMHMQGTPQTMQQAPLRDVVEEVLRLPARPPRRPAGRRHRAGPIALDPGIGFGKTTEHNLSLLGADRAVPRLGLPGAGRAVAQAVHRRGARRPAADRTAGTIGVALALARAACRSSASTTWPRCARPCCCFEAAAGDILPPRGWAVMYRRFVVFLAL